MWTDEKIAVLKKYWGVMKAKEIGQLIGATKNAVIGKAGRLRLARLQSNYFTPRSTEIPKMEITPIKPQSGNGVTFAECVSLNGCRYGYDNDTWCGQPTHKKQMCEAHYKLCYTRPVNTSAPAENQKPIYDIVEELP